MNTLQRSETDETLEVRTRSALSPRGLPQSGRGIDIVVWLVCLLALYPTVTMLYGSFQKSFLNPALTFEHYVSVYTDPYTLRLLIVTLLYAVSFAAIATCVGLALAWIITRTDTPLRSTFAWLILLPYVVPPAVQCVSWLLLLNPSNGFLNSLFRSLTGSTHPLMDVYSIAGMIFVSFCIGLPLAVTMLSAALERLDPSLEEAAHVCGASRVKIAMKVALPLVMPAVVSVMTLLTIIGVEAFEVPGFIGLPGHIFVLSSQIYYDITQKMPPDYGSAAAYGSVALLVALPMTLFYLRFVARQDRFAVISGRAGANRVQALGPLRWVAFGAVLAVILVIGVLPLSMIVLAAFFHNFTPLNPPSLASLTLHYVRSVLRDPIALTAFRNSVLLAVLGGFAAALIAFLTSWYLIRGRRRGKGFVEYVASMPYAMPGGLLAVGFLFGFVRSPLYGTVWLLGLAYITKYLALGIRGVSSSLMQVNKELEEAAAISGASFAKTLRRILLPLVFPGFISTWLLLVILFMRELSMSILLYASGSQVVSVVVYNYWNVGKLGEVGVLGVMLVLLTLVILLGMRRLIGSRFTFG